MMMTAKLPKLLSEEIAEHRFEHPPKQPLRHLNVAVIGKLDASMEQLKIKIKKWEANWSEK
jgi:hypothetical protein